MAITLGDAVLLLRANSDRLDSGLRQAETSTVGWASRLGGKVGPLIGGAIVGGATLAAGAVAGIGVTAFRVAQDMDAATKAIQTQLGVTAETAEGLAEIAQNVFGNNFANSIGEAAEAVALLEQQIGGQDFEIQGLAENAFRIRDAFGVDVAESISAVKTLMEEFGLSGEEAFDLITAGFQSGLNRSGDFLDTVEEYATQFSSAGADADEFFGLLASGLAGGVLGTDKAADAFKEFRLRILDGSAATAAGLAQIGLGDIPDQIAAGTISVAEAFDIVVGRLRETDDAATQIQAGTALLGTQFEDLGDAALGLSTIPAQFENIAGATEGLDVQYQNLGAAFEGLKRQALLALEPLGAELLELVQSSMPAITRGFEAFGEIAPGAVRFVVDAIERAAAIIGPILSGELPAGVGVTISAFDGVRAWFAENMPLIQQTVETVLGALNRFWSEHGALILRIVGRFMQILETIFETQLLNILDLFKVIMQLITGDVQGAGETLKRIAARTMFAFFSVINLWLGNVRDAFSNIDWGGLGRSIVQGIAAGISGAGHLIVSAAQGAAQGALGGVKSLLGIRSPSRVMAQQIGRPMAQGIAEGLRQELENMQLNLSGLSAAGIGAAVGPNVTVHLTQQFTGSAEPTNVARAARSGVDSAINLRRRRGH